jgi:hypothetical protein
MEKPAAGGTEAVPVVEQVQTPLFLMDSDPVDLLFGLEADKDSKEDLGHGSKHEDIGHGNERGRDKDEESRSEDRDAMVE